MKAFPKSRVIMRLLVVAKDVTVTSLASLHIDNGGVRILHGTLLNPGVDLLVGGQLEHLVDLLRAANSATTDLDTVDDEGEGVDVGELTTVRSTDLDESALGLEQGEVTIKRHLAR